MKIVHLHYSRDFWSNNNEIDYYLFGWNATDKTCLCVFENDTHLVCNKVLSLKSLPSSSSWYHYFLNDLALENKIDPSEFEVNEVQLKPAKIPIIIFPLDHSISFHFWDASHLGQFSIVQVICSDEQTYPLKDLRFIFNIRHNMQHLQHSPDRDTNWDNYHKSVHYQYLSTLTKKQIAAFCIIDEMRVWTTF